MAGSLWMYYIEAEAYRSLRGDPVDGEIDWNTVPRTSFEYGNVIRSGTIKLAESKAGLNRFLPRDSSL